MMALREQKHSLESCYLVTPIMLLLLLLLSHFNCVWLCVTP